VDVAVLRWQAFTGQVAVLEGQGACYAAVTLQRAAEGVTTQTFEPTPEGCNPVVEHDDRADRRPRKIGSTSALLGPTFDGDVVPAPGEGVR